MKSSKIMKTIPCSLTMTITVHLILTLNTKIKHELCSVSCRNNQNDVTELFTAAVSFVVTHHTDIVGSGWTVHQQMLALCIQTLVNQYNSTFIAN